MVRGVGVAGVGPEGGERATWCAPAPPQSPPAGVNFGAARAGWAKAGGAAGRGWPRNPKCLAGRGGVCGGGGAEDKVKSRGRHLETTDGKLA